MKKFLIVVGTILIASVSHAWEFNRNPDRFPSFGFNTDFTNMDGHRIEDSHPSEPLQRIDKGPQSLESTRVGIDLRLPLAQAVTVELGYDHLESLTKYRREPNVFTEDTSLSGYNIHAGFRFYFNK